MPKLSTSCLVSSLDGFYLTGSGDMSRSSRLIGTHSSNYWAGKYTDDERCAKTKTGRLDQPHGDQPEEHIPGCNRVANRRLLPATNIGKDRHERSPALMVSTELDGGAGA
jgi:hypothetical protein